MYKRFITLIICFLFQDIALHAENTVRGMILSASGVSEDDITSASSRPAISLYDAFALSVSNTEQLPMAGENILQARSLHSQAIGAYLPNISVNAEKSYAEENSGSGSKKESTSVYLYGKQPVMTGLNEWAAINKSKKMESISYNTLILSVQQQLLTVAQKYYSVCQIQSSLETSREIVSLYKQIRSELYRRVAVGKNRKNDLIRTDGQISRLEAQIASIVSQLETAKNELALSIGKKTSVPVSGVLNLPPPEFKPDNLQTVVLRRLEVAIARENSDVAKINLNTAMGGHLPSVYLEGNYSLYSRGDDSADRYNISLVASLPLFEGGTTSEKIAQAESAKRQAELALSGTTREVEKDIVSSYDTWDGCVKQANAYKKALESAEKNYEITMNDYRLSLVTIIDVISVMTELQQARDVYKTSVFALELSRLRLGVAINEFPGSGNLLLKNASQQAVSNLP